MIFFKNAKIRVKILAVFMSALFFLSALNLMSINQIRSVDNAYSDLIGAQTEDLLLTSQTKELLAQIRAETRAYWLYSGNASRLLDISRTNRQNYDKFVLNLELLRRLDSVNDLETIQRIEDAVTLYYETSVLIYQEIVMRNMAAALRILEDEALKAYDNAYKEMSLINTIVISHSTDISTGISHDTDILLISLLILLGVLILFLVFAGNMIVNMIVRPLQNLTDAAGKLSRGDLNVNVGSNGKDEVAILSNAISVVVSTIRSIVESIDEVADRFQNEGDIDARIDVKKYEGAYAEVASSINLLTEGFVQDVVGIMTCMRSYANGDFEATIAPYRGKKVVLNEAVDGLRNNLISISNDVNRLVQAASIGDLSQKMDPDLYKNDWANIANGLNCVLSDVIDPIREAIEALEKMSRGNLTVRIEGHYKGEFAVMKDALNNTLNFFHTCVEDVSYTLGEMSRENFDLKIETEYIGDFAPIKVALLQIISTFNSILSEIGGSAEQIATGATQISEFSMSLAQGATEQSDSVERLSRIFEITAEQNEKNASDADSANKLAIDAKETALEGNKEMNLLLEAMEEVNTSSSDICKIIAVIDSIAFQTNLLALNAAVEAARAGTHGKGFAVVADEVRSLASRSQNAAQDITQLIQNSVMKVSEGRDITNRTAETLQKIVEKITAVSSIAADVTSASIEQRGNLIEINKGIEQISTVTQSNAASSEEGASSAEELSSHAYLFKNMVSRFKLQS